MGKDEPKGHKYGSKYSSKDEPKHEPKGHKPSKSTTDHPTHSTTSKPTTTTAYPTYILTAQTDHSSKDNDGNYGVAYSGQSCSEPDQCSTGCCEDDVCVAKKKDWTNFFMYCPAECVGQIFGKRGTC